MFVRKKTTKSGAVKHYLVETFREDGKVRQKVLFYLGEHATVEEALAHWDAEFERNMRPLRDAKARIVARLHGDSTKADVNKREYELATYQAEFAQRFAILAARLREVIRSAQSGRSPHS